MPSYSYYKALTVSESPQKKNSNSFAKKLFRILPNVFIVIGATAVTTVIYPMFSYQLTTIQWEQKKIAAPIPAEELDSLKQMANSKNSIKFQDPAAPVMAYQEKDGQPRIVKDIDYTRADNWFPKTTTQNNPKQIIPKTTTYTISVPKVNIKDMTVEIGGTDLDKHLIHYGGTALPGEYGNPVIFGHSVLPVFYNPKNYMSVFSKIPTLKEGDEILVNYDGVQYKYAVESYHEVQPEQVEVLEQRYDRKTMTLITCVPPGTYLRRGVILARLEE